MHFMNYTKTVCSIIVITTACRRILALMLRAPLPPPPSFAPTLVLPCCSSIFTFFFFLTWERIGVHRFVCFQVLRFEKFCSAEKLISSGLCTGEFLAMPLTADHVSLASTVQAAPAASSTQHLSSCEAPKRKSCCRCFCPSAGSMAG